LDGPKNLLEYTGKESVAKLGASLAWALVRSHPFSDGNRRAAYAALVIFLDINGYRPTCSEVEETGMMLRAAASEISEEEFSAWVQHSIAPLE